MKVDAANGVGGASMRKVMGGVRGEWLKVELCNDGSGILNDQVRRLHVTIKHMGWLAQKCGIERGFGPTRFNYCDSVLISKPIASQGGRIRL